MRLLTALARLMLAGIFVVSGADAARAPGQRAERAQRLGLPQPELTVRANGAAMVAGGLALAVGYRPKLTSLLLLGSLAPTTYAGHPFWEEKDPAERSRQLTQFAKNLGLAGGLVAVIGTPSRRRLRQAKRRAKARARRAARAS